MKPDEAVVYDFVMELSTKHQVSDETFDRAKAASWGAAGRGPYRGHGNIRNDRHVDGNGRGKRSTGQGAAI